MHKQDISLPRELTHKLARFESHLRQLAVARGVATTLFVFIVGVTVGLLVDLFWELAVSVRIALLAGVGAVTFVCFCRRVLVPAFRRPGDAELASLVEQSHPELKERLTSAIELNDPGVPEEWKGSALMRELLLKQTTKRVGSLDFAESVSPAATQKAVFLAVMAVTLWCVPFLFFPSGYLLMVSRFFAPWGNHHSPGNLVFEVTGGDRVVARGSDVPIETKVSWRKGEGRPPESVWLNWTDAAGQRDRRRMQFDEALNGYTTRIPHVFSGFEFNVSAGRSRSRDYRIDVVEAPLLTSVALDVEPPSYTGFNAQSLDGVVGEVEVFERSRLTYRLRFNKPLAAAELVWVTVGSAPIDRGNARMNAGTTNADISLPFELSADRLSATLSTTAERSGPFSLRATDEHGLSNVDEPGRTLIVVADQPPTLSFPSSSLGTSGSEGSQAARPDDIVPITVSAADDLGVASLELHYDLFRGSETVVAVDAQQLGRTMVSHRFELDLAALGIQEGAVLKYRVRAADERPVPGPNEVWSEPRLITVTRTAAPPGTAEVAARQRALREKLQAIRGELGENRDQVRELRDEAKSDLRMQLEFAGNPRIRPLAQQEQQLAAQVDELAAEFSQHPLYANLVDETAKIAREDLPETSRHLAAAADQELRDKADSLEETDRRLGNIDNRLAALGEQFEELAKLELDLQELNRLARKAEQLADAALDLEQRRNEPPPAGETPEQQQAREQQLDEAQQLLAQEQRRLADQLNDLLDRRPELLEAARDDLAKRLIEMSRQARELAERQDLLADAVQEESQQSARAAAPLAERQQELLREAEQLAADVNRLAADAPVRPVDPALLRQALEDLKAGNLNDAIQRQQAAADDLQAVADELQKNQQLPADPQQAAEQLAKRQDELQRKVAEAANNAPEAEAEREQFARQLRRLAAEQAGIEAGLSQLDVPARNRPLQQDAVDSAADAVERLLDNDSADASDAARRAADEMRQLAEQIGNTEQRRERAIAEAEQLRERQQELANQVAEALGNRDPDAPQSTAERLRQLAREQEQVARQLAQLDAPGAEAEQQSAVRQSAAAMTDLERSRAADAPASQQQAEQAIARMQRQLAGESTPEDEAALAVLQNQPDPAEQARRLAERQRRSAEAAQRAADADQPRSAEQRSQAQNTLAGISRDAEQLRVGDAAQQEKQEALEQLQKASEAQEAAERLRKRAEQPAKDEKPADTKTSPATAPLTPEEAAKQLQQLMKGEAEAQQAAADALERLERRLSGEESREQLAQEQQQASERAEQLAQPPGRDPQQVAEAAEQLADEQRDLRGETERLNDEVNAQARQEQAQPVADNQEQLRDRAAGQLPRDIAPLSRADALRNLEAAREALARGETQQAARAQQQAEESLRDVQRQAEAMAEANRQPRTEESAQAARQAAQQAAERAAQLAQQQRELQQELAQQQMSEQRQLAEAQAGERRESPGQPGQPQSGQPEAGQPQPGQPQPGQPNQPSASQPATAPQPSQPGQEPSQPNQQPSQPNGQSPQNGPPANALEAQERQRRLANEAARMAVEVARQTGAESEAAGQAVDFARQAAEAARQGMTGQLQQAGETAAQAAQAAQQAAGQLGADEPDQTQPGGRLARQAGELAQRQQQLAESFEQFAQSSDERRTAQQSAQERLAQAAHTLAEGLSNTGQRMQSEPINQQRQAQQAQAAQASTAQAGSSMQRAEQNLQNNDVGNAAQSGRQAAEALRQAAELAAGVSTRPANESSPLPPQVGAQVAEASQQIQQAGEQLAQAGSQPMSNGQQQSQSGQSGQQGQQGQQGQSQPAGAQNQNGQSGEAGQSGQPGQNGQQPPSALAQSAQSLRQAAQSLSQAAQGLQPGSGNPGSQSQQANAGQQNSADPSDGMPGEGDGNGTQATLDMQQLENELKRLTGRNWGQLPGKLQTEIVDASRKRPHGDYAKLIKLYFEEIAKTQK